MNRNLWSRLNPFSRRDNGGRPALSSRRSAGLESLEKRLFMHSGPLQVSSVVADNRGEVIMTLNQAIKSSNVNSASVQMFAGGTDGIVGTSDDVRLSAELKYQETGSQFRIIARARTLAANNGYRLKIVSTGIETPDGDVHLDGEFNGTLPSGNGLSGGGSVSGGNFEFQVKNDTSANPLVRMSTSEGVITLKMRKDLAPQTVNNFLVYANSKRYDSIFFTRSIPGFIIQGGSLQIGDATNVIAETTVDSPVVNEFNLGNTRGTFSMAKQGGNPNSATNQFFFNLADNRGTSPNGLDFQNGGFTAFAQVTNASGLAVMDAIAGKPTTNIGSQVGPFAATDISTTPVQNKAQADAGLDPHRDLIQVRRTSLLMKIAKV